MQLKLEGVKTKWPVPIVMRCARAKAKIDRALELLVEAKEDFQFEGQALPDLNTDYQLGCAAEAHLETLARRLQGHVEGVKRL